MRCYISPQGPKDVESEAEFVGLMLDDHGDTLAVVRRKGYGMMLHTIHPTRVRLIDAAGEGPAATGGKTDRR